MKTQKKNLETMKTEKKNPEPKAKRRSYEFIQGRSCGGLKAQAVGEELQRIRIKNGGELSPRDVVSESEPDDALLHGLFEWDDAIGGKLYREIQARQTIRCVEEVRYRDDGTEEKRLRPLFVSICPPFKSEQGYIETEAALADPETREIVLSQAISQLRAWRRRYGHLEELASVSAAIEDINAPSAV